MNKTLDWMKELLFLLYCLQMLQLDFAVGRWDSAESEKSLWAETRGDRRVLYVLPAPLTSMWAQIAHWKPDNYRDAKHRSPEGQLGKLWWTANKGRDFFFYSFISFSSLVGHQVWWGKLTGVQEEGANRCGISGAIQEPAQLFILILSELFCCAWLCFFFATRTALNSLLNMNNRNNNNMNQNLWRACLPALHC